MSIVIDAKVFVLLVLYENRSCKNEFEKCVRASKPQNTAEETCIKNISDVMKWIIREISSGREIYVTPQILAEFSNWLEKYVKGEKYYELMKEVAINFLKKNSSECYVEMNKILQEEKILIKFGFTEVSIYLCPKELNKDEKIIILTSDGKLAGFCRNNNINAWNVYDPNINNLLVG